MSDEKREIRLESDGEFGVGSVSVDAEGAGESLVDEVTAERLASKRGRSNFIGLVIFGGMILIIGVVLGSRIDMQDVQDESLTIECVGGRSYSEAEGLRDYEFVGDSLVIYLENNEKIVFKNKEMCTIKGE